MIVNKVIEVDPATADTSLVGAITIAGDLILGFTGFAVDPSTDVLHGVAILDSEASRQTRHLVTIDLGSLTATDLGAMSEIGVAGITFLVDGTLLAVTGDGGGNPETLWNVDKANGAMTVIMALGAGNDGEAIVALPARLTGSLTATAVNGVATFDDLVIDAPAAGYTLRASATDLEDGTSAPFEVLVP